MQKHLGVAIDAFVKLDIRVSSLVQRDVVGYNEGRLSAPRDDQVAKETVIFLGKKLAARPAHSISYSMTHLDVALTRADSEPLLEELAERERDIAFGRVGVGRTGIFGNVEPGNAEAACRANDSN